MGTDMNCADSKRYRHVLEPIRIASCTIPNRVVRTAHFTALGDGTMNEDRIAYNVARARGGVGLTILEVLSVHPSAPAVFGLPVLHAWDENLVAGYRSLMAAVKPYGMKVFQQLWHGGPQSIPRDGSPPWGPSDIPSLYAGVVPHVMSAADIHEVVGAFAHSAALCEEAGLDGVEIHAMGGYLHAQFLSELTNKRTDEYGGSFDNRLRFTLEVLSAVRNKVSSGFPVGIRLGTDDVPGGLDTEDLIRVAKLLEERELVDFFNITMGGWWRFERAIGALHEPTGYQLPTCAPVAAAVRLPTILCGRFRTLEEAEQVIRTGEADLVGMTRAHLADPEIVLKTREGREDQVRPCIGCNQGCLGGMMIEGRIACTVNAAAGLECTLGEDKLQRSETPKRVLVVGGGPAGLEAARVAALRGNRVTLMEARAKLGGALNFARYVPRLQGLCDIADWLVREVERLGVQVHTNCYVESEDVYRLRPDAVIIATGSVERMDGVQSGSIGRPATGMDLPHVMSSTALLSNRDAKIGRSAVVADDVGHFEGIAVAEYLIDKGVAVTFVTGKSGFAPLMEAPLRAEPGLRRLSKGNFELVTRANIHRICEDSVEVRCLYDDSIRQVPAETVVMISHNRPDSSLREALAEYTGLLFVIGDAASPRFLRQAIREGYHAGSIV